MKPSYTDFNHYNNINYRIKWNLDPIAKVKNNVENLNDFREARQIIRNIKNKLQKPRL